MSRMRVCRIVLAGLTLALGAALVSPSIVAQQAEAPAAKKDEADVTGKAKYMKTIWGDKKKTVHMKGEVSFTHGDTVITSDEVNYDDTAKEAVSPGSLKISNPECDVNGDKGTAYFKKKLGVVEGNVVMSLKPKPGESGTDADSNSIDRFKQPTTVTCKRMEYFYARKVASAQGGVIFKQPKRTVYADKAVYDQNKEILTLTGNVRGTEDDGTEYSAPGEVKISLKKGDEWLEAPNASGSFKIDLSEEEEE